VWLAGGGSASAHNTVESSDPADGAVLDASPPTWTVTFDKEVPIDSASGVLQGPDGARTPLPPPRHGTSARDVVFDLPAALSGAYTARWRLVGTDGHVISGRVSFVVAAPPVDAGTAAPATAADGEPVGGGSTVPTEPGTVPDGAAPSADEPTGDDPFDAGGTPAAVRWLVRLLTLAALAFAFGVLTTDFAVAHGAIRLVRRSTVGRAILAAVAIAPVLELATFAVDATAGGGVPLADVLATVPGTMLLLRVAAGILAAACLAFAAFSPTGTAGYGTAATAVLVMATTVSWVGHSRSEGTPWLGVPLDVAHSAAMGAWLGGLAVTFGAVARHLSDADLQRALRRFGSVASWSVAILVATGTAQALRLHGGVPSGRHGAILAVKLVLVAGMVVLASLVRRRLSHSVAADRGGLVRLALAEIGTGAAVLGASAALVLTSPT